MAMVSLGCSRNLVDAEQMLGALTHQGYVLVTDPREAEVVIVNTCGFIEAARQEALREIRAAARWKRSGRCAVLVVTGCMAQKEPDRIRRSCPEVDALVGLSKFGSIAAVVEEALAGAGPVAAISAPNMPYQEYLPRRRVTAPWTSYLKIAEGCDCACSFCTIPSIRGRFRSRAPEDIEREARALAAEGVKEINLIAEDTTHYGHDRTGRRELPDLLARLAAIDELLWIRLLYCYPTKIDRELMAALADLPRVARYLDMPLQHAHDDVLRAMNRGGSRASYLRLIDRLREQVPDICLRSTFIVGFPGERREHFEALASFLEAAALDRVGFFCYSPEPDTLAAQLSGRVPPGVARARLAELAARQECISLARNRDWIGRRLQVLVERVGDGEVTGRSFRDAPDIDGVVRIDGEATPGTVIEVTVTGAAVHDLDARVDGS